MANDSQGLISTFKQVYGEDQVLVPSSSIVQMILPFKEQQRIGRNYEFPVILANENAASYIAGGSDAIQTLEDSVAMTVKSVTVDSSQIIMRAQASLEALMKSQNDKVAFRKNTEMLVENLQESMSKRLEISLLYGNVGFAVGDSSANVDATHTTVTLTAASFSAGLLGGLEGAKINFYKQSDNTLVSSSTNAIFTIDSVDLVNKTVRVSGTATGITALDTALGAGDCDIFFKNSKSAEMTGLFGITANTGSLFGISAADYGLWKANRYNVNGAISFLKIQEGLAQAVAKGMSGKVTLLISPKGWAKLNSDEGALRQYIDDKTTAKRGYEAIMYHYSGGVVEIVAHPFMQEGRALAVCASKVKRIGSTDITLNNPITNEPHILSLQDKNAVEFRAFVSNAVVCEAPAAGLVEFYGITYS